MPTLLLTILVAIPFAPADHLEIHRTRFSLLSLRSPVRLLSVSSISSLFFTQCVYRPDLYVLITQSLPHSPPNYSVCQHFNMFASSLFPILINSSFQLIMDILRTSRLSPPSLLSHLPITYVTLCAVLVSLLIIYNYLQSTPLLLLHLKPHYVLDKYVSSLS